MQLSRLQSVRLKLYHLCYLISRALLVYNVRVLKHKRALKFPKKLHFIHARREQQKNLQIKQQRLAFCESLNMRRRLFTVSKMITTQGNAVRA